MLFKKPVIENTSFLNRAEAGRALAEKLQSFKFQDNERGGQPIVLALPRGGVPVAAEISAALNLPLDIVIVRKLGMPGREEFAMGAVASGGVEFLDKKVVDIFSIKTRDIERIRSEQLDELHRRETTYRGNKPWPDLNQRCVILVDDGIATGATMRAAIQVVKNLGVSKIVVAVPVAPKDTLKHISQLVDETVCLSTPENFNAVSQWYNNFSQVTDEEVHSLLLNA